MSHRMARLRAAAAGKDLPPPKNDTPLPSSRLRDPRPKTATKPERYAKLEQLAAAWLEKAYRGEATAPDRPVARCPLEAATRRREIERQREAERRAAEEEARQEAEQQAAEKEAREAVVEAGTKAGSIRRRLRPPIIAYIEQARTRSEGLAPLLALAGALAAAEPEDVDGIAGQLASVLVAAVPDLRAAEDAPDEVLELLPSGSPARAALDAAIVAALEASE